jgi:hypothetical protein
MLKSYKFLQDYSAKVSSVQVSDLKFVRISHPCPTPLVLHVPFFSWLRQTRTEAQLYSQQCKKMGSQLCQPAWNSVANFMELSPSWEAITQLLKNFPIFYGTRRFITVFATALNWSLSWVRSIQSTQPQPISLRYILILSTHLRLGLPNGLLPSGFPPISYMHFSPPPHSCYVHHSSHPPWLDHSNYTWRRVRVIKSSLEFCRQKFLLHILINLHHNSLLKWDILI